MEAKSRDDRSIINPGALPVRCVIFPDPLSRITGVFADDTDTASLTVISYEAAETLIWEKRGDA
ncbi:MAG: hypothetical protein KAU03_04780 [Candidatus Altiarchaeales archaeon]|nr:hypothetical protein [Candidatus Altiarchaeales archaeon]